MIIHSVRSDHPVLEGLLQALADDAGPVHALADDRFAPCLGCFECWTAHPGTCRATDGANGLMRDIVHAETVVWVTHLTLGSWSADTKRALDKTIGLISPFFRSFEGETHHRRRYARLPRFAGVAVVPADTPQSQRDRFHALVRRNALNMDCTHPWSVVVEEGWPASRVAEAVRTARDAPEQPVQPRDFALPEASGPDVTVGKAVLLVGSGKPAGESASEQLGRVLLEGLDACGWQTEVVGLARAVKLQSPSAPRLLEAVSGAHLVVLATPVYIDTVPALVTTALEHLLEAPRTGRPPALVPIVQCGFPETLHTEIAVEVLADAAEALGWTWAGHLAVGGGGAIQIRGENGAAWRQVAALKSAAAALARAEPIPSEATAEFAIPAMGPKAYRLMGDLGWTLQAAQHGALLRLFDQPFRH